MKLVLAGPRNTYYEEVIAPLVDGVCVEYAGSVTGEARANLLGGAAVLLYPIVEPEPFGLVMPEAMMCGTPVVATGLGAVPEIVNENITGFYAYSPGDLPELVHKARLLDRRLVRLKAEERFSVERMAVEYLRVYEEVASS
jgi:glycosyltransferase involved in cell wall biosynthesis